MTKINLNNDECQNIDIWNFQLTTNTVAICSDVKRWEIMEYDCDGTLRSVSTCDLAERIFDCSCIDLFDLCCMPGCEEGTYLRVNNCNDCLDKYEWVTACEIWNEIAQNDKCWFEIDVDCELLEPLFTVSGNITEEPYNFGFSCEWGLMTLKWTIPDPFVCEDIFDCFPEDIFECPEQTCEDILWDLSCSMWDEECPPCEDCNEDECDRYKLEYCISEKVLRVVQDPEKFVCNRPPRFESKLVWWPMHIQQDTEATADADHWPDRIYYLSSVELPVTQLLKDWWASPIARIWSATQAWGTSSLVKWDTDDWSPCWDHCNENSIVSWNWFAQYTTAWSERVYFEFHAEQNKAIHAWRIWLMKIPCWETDWELITQLKTGAPVGKFYKLPDGCEIPEELMCAYPWIPCNYDNENAPNIPNLFFWPTSCNELTTAFQWPPWDPETAWTFSLGRWIEALTFNGWTKVSVMPWDIIVPVLLLSSSMTWDCDAQNNPNKAVFSILWQGSTQWWGRFTTQFWSFWLNTVYEKKCLNDKFGCKHGWNAIWVGWPLDCSTTLDVSCNFDIYEPEQVCLEPWTVQGYEPPEPPETCEFTSQEDCPEDTTFSLLNPQTGCGICLANTVPWTWADWCEPWYIRDPVQEVCVLAWTWEWEETPPEEPEEEPIVEGEEELPVEE